MNTARGTASAQAVGQKITMKPHTSPRLLAGALLVCLAVPSLAQGRTVSVQLNGQPLGLSAQPLSLGGRTLLPLRDVFESLGASVNWNPIAQSISAQSGQTQIQLGINNPIAFVNGRNVSLDQPAVLVGGRAFVPLRFVAEATGATVDYNPQLDLVSIQKYNPLPTSGSQVADYHDERGGFSSISVPSDAVVPVQLDQALSSNTSRVGDTFTASVVSRRLGDSEFPAGTKLEGLVTEARPADRRNPGVLDLRFQSAILPSGERVPLRGHLISLDQGGVAQVGGRLVAQDGRRKNDDLKIIGIGAGAGFVLGRILNTDSTVSTILGAAGGYLFSRSRNRQAREARLKQNTVLGVALDQSVRFRDANDYGRVRQAFLGNNSDGFDPREYGYDTRVNASVSDRYEGYDVTSSLPAPSPDAVANPRTRQDDGRFDDGQQPIYPDDAPAQATNNTGWQGGALPDDEFNRPVLAQQISVPRGAVVPVRLDQGVSSATARVGDRVTASVDSQRLGDSEFPAGTKIQGEIIEARPRTQTQPGVLDIDWQSALLPGGARVPLHGELVSLDDGSIQSTGGRLVARSESRTNADRAKVIGIGAAAGFVIGRVFKKNGVLPPLLGALGGYLYGEGNRKTRTAEAVLPRDARLGVRLDEGVNYNGGTYYASRAEYLRGR